MNQCPFRWQHKITEGSDAFMLSQCIRREHEDEFHVSALGYEHGIPPVSVREDEIGILVKQVKDVCQLLSNVEQDTSKSLRALRLLIVGLDSISSIPLKT